MSSMENNNNQQALEQLEESANKTKATIEQTKQQAESAAQTATGATTTISTRQAATELGASGANATTTTGKTNATTTTTQGNENTLGNKYSWRTNSRADAAQQRYNELLAVYPNPTQSQIEAALGKDTMAWQSVYGGGNGRFGTMLGRGALWGRVDSNTLKGLEERRKAMLEQAQPQKPEETQNTKVLGLVKRSDGTETNVTTSDRNRLMGWMDKMGENNKDISPEQVNELKTILNDMGYDVTTDKVNGSQTVSTALQSLMATLPNEDADALEDALSVMGTTFNADGTVSLPHTMTYEELQAERDAQKEKIDLRTRQRDLERRQARVGLADIAASIGEMIRASQGATVTSRDLRDMYNNLTAQQRANYDSYVARVQKMKEDAKAVARENAKRKQDRENALADKEAERQWQKAILEKQHDWKVEDDETNRTWQEKEAEKNRKMQIQIALGKNAVEMAKLNSQYGRENVNKVVQSGGIYWKGSLYGTGGNGGNNTLIDSIYGLLMADDTSYQPQDDSNIDQQLITGMQQGQTFKTYLQGIMSDMPSTTPEMRQNVINAAVISWISQNESQFSPAMQAKIENILNNGLSGGYVHKISTPSNIGAAATTGSTNRSFGVVTPSSDSTTEYDD